MGGERSAVELLLNPALAGGVGIAPASTTATTMHISHRGGLQREPMYPPLHVAAIEGHADAIEALLVHGVDVDQQSSRK
jgi:ankyrin repeat protein